MKLENNKSINTLLTDNKINENEYKILFENKKDYTKEQTESFKILLQQIIDLQIQFNEKPRINLDYLIFPDFIFKNYNWGTEENISFRFTTFSGKAHFGNIHFSSKIYFNKATFYQNVYFKDTIFLYVVFNYAVFRKIAYFNKASFSHSVSFRKAHFYNNAYFSKTIFQKKSDFYKVLFKKDLIMRDAEFHSSSKFWGSSVKGLVDFYNLAYSEIDLTNFKYNDANFLHMRAYFNNKYSSLNKKNFSSKNPTLEGQVLVTP